MLTLIFILLFVAVMLLGFIAWKVHRAFANLSEERLAIYVALAGEMNAAAERLRRGKEQEKLDEDLAGRFKLLGSFPTMQAGSQVFARLTEYRARVKASAPPGQIASAEQALEKSLIDLNTTMRQDLLLNSVTGRFPSAEVFRRKRATP